MCTYVLVSFGYRFLSDLVEDRHDILLLISSEFKRIN